MAAFAWVGAWLAVSALPESPRLRRAQHWLVTALLATFGLASALVAGAGSRRAIPGALILLAIAAYHWWKRPR